MFYPGFLQMPPKPAAINNLTAARAPASSDDIDSGYAVDSVWIFGSAIYICTDNKLRSAVWQAIAVLPISIMPVGFCTVWWTTSAPALWLLCHGQSLVRADYAALFAVIGTTFGAADGSHFSLPDLRGLIPRCAGTPPLDSSISFNGQGGRDAHNISVSEMPSHLHAVGTLKVDLKQGAGTDNNTAAKGTAGSPLSSTGVITGSTDNQGGGGSMSLQNPYRGCEYIIYAGV